MNNGGPPGGNLHGYYHQQGLSLLGGWLPLAVQILVVVVVLLAVGWRTRRWRLLWVPVCAGIGLLGALGAMVYFDSSGLASDAAPVMLWVWLGVSLATLAVLVLGWRGNRWWRRGVSVLAVPLSLLCVGLVLNQWVGYFPTVQEAWGEITSGPLPGQVAADQLPALQGKGATMKSGVVVNVNIPDTASHFSHREEYVYLPPAYFTGSQHPVLPVVMMIAGEFNTAADWIRTGNALPTIDQYAQTHGGVAPILVFVDAGGTFNNDTECVNGPRGNAADHLTEDVRPYVLSHFGASPDPKKWGIVGWSMGGTCAADLAVMHPELFDSFEDIAGDLGPAVGDKQQTIQRLYGGDAAAWARFDPTTVLAHHARYTDTAGWFDDSSTGGMPPGFVRRPHPGGFAGRRGGGGGGGFGNEEAEARQLCGAMGADGIQCALHTQPGGHTWQFAGQAFADALPWFADRMQLANQRN
jgi:S-formylglutathione hydrolase FrmB